MLSTCNYAPGPVRLVIADDHAIFRKGLTTMLMAETGLQVVGEAGNGKELVAVVQDKKPDVVITDIQMPVMGGLEATKAIKKDNPTVGVVALSMFEDENMVLAMMQAGAKGYLLKNTSKEEIAHAVQVVSTQGTYYCSTASNNMVRLMERTGFNPYAQSKQPQFSERDVQIIRLLCREYSNKEIAAALHINQRAVEGARERIQEKTGAHNMVGIVVYAIRHGIFNIA